MRRVQLKDLTALSVAERVQLAEDLWDSVALSSRELPVTDAQRLELDRRLEARKKNPASRVPWEEVRERLRKHR